MTALAQQTSARRRLLLASDRIDNSQDLAAILGQIAEVEIVPTAALPATPAADLCGIVIDIDLRSSASVQQIRSRLLGGAYQPVPRLFVLANELHHGTMQAWALGATDTIARPLDARGILQRIRAAFPDAVEAAPAAGSAALSKGVAAAHAVLVRIFERLPAGTPLSFDDVMKAETHIVKAIKRSSLREWLAAVGRHHNESYRLCLFATGFAVAFARHLGMREADQRRLTRAALLYDVGKAFVDVAALIDPDNAGDAQLDQFCQHPRLGFDALSAQGGFPPEVLDVVLHHHELLDGSGYPDRLQGGQISDIVRIITVVDLYASLIARRGKQARSPAEAFAIMEAMGDKIDQPLLQAFRPVAFGG